MVVGAGVKTCEELRRICRSVRASILLAPSYPVSLPNTPSRQDTRFRMTEEYSPRDPRSPAKRAVPPMPEAPPGHPSDSRSGAPQSGRSPSHTTAIPAPSLRTWIRASTLGWLLGIPTIAILALLGEAVGVGGSQALVGLGMGAAVGWMQGRQVSGLGVRRSAWFWASVLGIGLPFLGWDVARHLDISLEYSLLRLLLLGGALTGVAQGWLLGTARSGRQGQGGAGPSAGAQDPPTTPQVDAASSGSPAPEGRSIHEGAVRSHALPATLAWWTAGSLAAWGAAGWSSGLGDMLIKSHKVAGLLGALLYLAAVGLGGPLLGFISGGVLQRFRR